MEERPGVRIIQDHQQNAVKTSHVQLMDEKIVMKQLKNACTSF